MKHVYIAGPFRAETPWLVELNVQHVEALGFIVASLGAVPLVPHAMYRHFNGTITDEFWLAATMSLLERCDAVLLSERWESSSGARAERERALSVGIPVFAHVGLLNTWLDGRRS